MVDRAVCSFVFVALLATTVAAQETSPTGAATAPEPEVSREEFEALQQQMAELEARMDEADAARMDDLAGEFKPSLDVYGFMAVYGGKWFVEKSSPLYGVMNTKLSFGVTDINVYLSGHVTRTVDSLVELRFTFMPHGADEFPTLARMDTTVVNANTSEEFTLGGVIVERAQFTWQPRDFIGVTAGRFLTPFGIWNIDHGAPVIIPVNQPYIILRHLMPLAQTGVYIHGRVFPLSSLQFEYGLTLSNGRGPADASYDVDENKAVGLRLRFDYRHNRNVGVALGAYGFLGTRTDDVKAVDVASLAVGRDVTEKYREYAASADLLLTLWGFRIQSEWAGAVIRYDVRPPSVIPLLDISDASHLQPDYLRWDVYVMLAYEWKFKTRMGEMRLTPYVLGERDVMYDNTPLYNVWFLRWGLNFRPHPRVTFKLDATAGTFPDNDLLSDVWNISGQASLVF